MRIRLPLAAVLLGALLATSCSKTAEVSKAKEEEHNHEGHDHDEEKKKATAVKADAHEGHNHAAEGEHKAEHVKVEIDQQRANRFEFAEAQERTVARLITTTGTVAPNESRIARLRPLARGRILSVNVRIGDAVRKGQELLAYDNVELGEAIGQYLRVNADIEKARTEAGVARRALDRAKNLVDLGGIARTELDKREADAKNAEAAINAEIAEQAVWQEKLYRFGLQGPEIEALATRKMAAPQRERSRVTLSAPFDGIVLKMNAAEGEAIQPETQLFEIVDTSTVWVQADLYERDLTSVRVGDVATVTLEAYPDEKFRGRVTYISDTVDRDSRTPKIRCEVANPGRRLKLDQYATIQLPGKGDRRVLMVPVGAVQQLEGKTVVFVREEPNEFEIRAVKTGAEVQGWIEIESGVKAGDTVATRGSFVLKAEHMKAELGEAGHSHD